MLALLNAGAPQFLAPDGAPVGEVRERLRRIRARKHRCGCEPIMDDAQAEAWKARRDCEAMKAVVEEAHQMLSTLKVSPSEPLRAPRFN